MTFVVRKKIDLSFLGEGWQEAYVIFTPFTFGDNTALLKLRTLSTGANISTDEAEKASKDIMELLQNKFVEGKGWDGEKLIDITKKNLVDLPMEIISHILTALQGQTTLPPNA